MMNIRRIFRARRWLLAAASLPLLQFSQCNRAITLTLEGVANQLPQIIFNALLDGTLQALLSAFGAGTSGLGGGLGGGGGFGGGGFGGGGGI
jgi:uncharacterized protein